MEGRREPEVGGVHHHDDVKMAAGEMRRGTGRGRLGDHDSDEEGGTGLFCKTRTWRRERNGISSYSGRGVPAARVSLS
eukprot:2105991-Rhodomonas_salina.1